MITVYKFGALEGVCDASPFCVKVEAYLRMAGLTYESQAGPEYVMKSPKHKLPYIEDNGLVVADSSAILNYLKDTYGDSVDGHLSDVDKAIAIAFIRLIEESLYWVLVHARWCLSYNSTMLQHNIFSQPYFARIPSPLRAILIVKIKRDIKNQLYLQGTGRHTDAEITELGDQNLLALANFLRDKPFFLGAQPSSLDAVAYGMLANMLLVTCYSAPIFEKAKTYQNLVEFTHRFHQRYFAL
ncbi:MAG: glutathione S-transferase C-terminal domain-containing protein [Methylococcaceae bacterium]|jgi:glutathione S-transferase